MREKRYTLTLMNRRGITLLELVIVTSLIGLVGLSFAFLYSSSQRFLIQSANFTSSQGEASFGLEHIKRRLLQAIAMAVPAAGETRTLTNGGVTVQFTWLPNRAALPLGLDCQYRLSGDNLQFQRGAGGTWEPIARGIESVTFTRTAQSVISVEIAVTRNAGRDIERRTRLQTVVSPRGLQ